MNLSRRMLVMGAVLLLSMPVLRAQAPADPSGHWTGSLQAPEMDMNFDLDLVKNSKGEIVGAVSIPAQNVKGLPLLTATVEGRSVTFRARKDQGFVGTLSADGKTIVGDFTGTGPLGGEFSLPFSLNRTGIAKIDPPIKNAAISKGLTGTWNASIDRKGGTPLRFVLTLSNHPDGTATGRMVNVDEGGLELPLAITQKGVNVTFEFRAVGGSYSGTLNAAGTELVGTFTQGPASAPMTFRRAQATDARKGTDAKR